MAYTFHKSIHTKFQILGGKLESGYHIILHLFHCYKYMYLVNRFALKSTILTKVVLTRLDFRNGTNIWSGHWKLHIYWTWTKNQCRPKSNNPWACPQPYCTANQLKLELLVSWSVICGAKKAFRWALERFQSFTSKYLIFWYMYCTSKKICNQMNFLSKYLF